MRSVAKYTLPLSQAREIRRSSGLFTIRSSVIGLAGPPRWNSLPKSSGRDLLSLRRFDRRESTRSGIVPGLVLSFSEYIVNSTSTPLSQAREIRRSSVLFTIRSSVIGLFGPPRWNSLQKSSGRDSLSLGRFDRRESTRSGTGLALSSSEYIVNRFDIDGLFLEFFERCSSSSKRSS
ncbi:hypothetical protein CDAR_477481 [Caerostris darwini]|uniref:Uncharacterized protein n=1 Tax=Caerostris darwini TaxID=1538125 RepID=A0AAV4SYH7_9ARAC|nr:hypothetical protein CDAR_477481 [Caerostris darwini]